MRTPFAGRSGTFTLRTVRSGNRSLSTDLVRLTATEQAWEKLNGFAVRSKEIAKLGIPSSVASIAPAIVPE